MLRYGKTVLLVSVVLGVIVSLFSIGMSAFLVDAPVSLINLAGFIAYLIVGTAIFRVSPMWPEELNWKWYLICLLWGGCASVGVVSVIGSPISTVLKRLNLMFFEAALGGAYPEEISKLLGVALILIVSQRFSRPWHGFVVGGMVGLGFEAFENIVYGSFGAMIDPNSDVDGALSVWGYRTVAGPGLHMCLTAISGLAIGYAIYLADIPMRKRLAYMFGVLGTSFLLHFAWNTIISAGNLQIAWWIGVAIVLYGTFLSCWVHCVRQIKTEGSGPITVPHLPLASLEEPAPDAPPATQVMPGVQPPEGFSTQ